MIRIFDSLLSWINSCFGGSPGDHSYHYAMDTQSSSNRISHWGTLIVCDLKCMGMHISIVEPLPRLIVDLRASGEGRRHSLQDAVLPFRRGCCHIRMITRIQVPPHG
jgi:hypothetical protein